MEAAFAVLFLMVIRLLIPFGLMILIGTLVQRKMASQV